MTDPSSGAFNAAPAQRALPEGTLLTTHRVFTALDPAHRGLAWLHADLFDARTAVALSALEAVATISDPTSFPHLVRLLSRQDEEVQRGALRALGRLRHQGAAGVLLGLLKTAQSDETREAILDAIAANGHGGAEVVELVRRTAHSPIAAPAARARAADVLLAIAGKDEVQDLIAGGREEVLERVLDRAPGDSSLAPLALRQLAPRYRLLPVKVRASLVRLAGSVATPTGTGVLRAGILDAEAGVRRAAYAAIGTESHHAGMLDALVDALMEEAERAPSIEDEAAQAISRLAQRGGAATPTQVAAKLRMRIGELFKRVRVSQVRLSSDEHELGWIIQRGTEYLEYYADEDLKGAILRHLRGIGALSAEELLRRLKATAVRVEVRHFDGYTALCDLIRNPKRSGAALIMRELALVHTGKGHVFNCLVRALRLAVLCVEPGASVDRQQYEMIFEWARGERLYRLAEAALGALAKVDPRGAVASCMQCLAKPLASRILAIAALHLLRDINRSALEPAATGLLDGPEDPYLLLNVVEALSGSPPTSNGELVRSLLSVLQRTSNREISEKVAAYLGEHSEVDLAASRTDLYRSGVPLRREAALTILEGQVAADRLANREGATEFLYGVLRAAVPGERGRAAVLLWKLGDEYAREVIGDLLATAPDAEQADLLRALRGHLRPSLVPVLERPLLAGEPLADEALRELLLSATDGAADAALELVLRVRGGGPEEAEGDLPAAAAGEEPSVQFNRERESYRFEREQVVELSVLFTDIVGYSKTAQGLTPMQLAGMLQEYERNLLAVLGAHHGELVKRMGDGHLFVFGKPLEAVLAAIRLQKSMRRFNRYREEALRVVIRVGVHFGKVVRKEGGDVLGTTVNIASRLESAAQSGSILVSDAVFDRVKTAIHARELGAIAVKNFDQPVRVYEPYEVALDLSAEQDPLREAAQAADVSTTQPRMQAPAASPGVVLVEFSRTFQHLHGLCCRVEAGEATVGELRRAIAASWGQLRALFDASRAAPATPAR